jgi:polyisoprenyl-teichoic acid--peptidoglycan teichoic acid transferase
LISRQEAPVEYRSSTAADDRPGRSGGVRAGGGTQSRKGRGKAPWWARLLVIFGALMMIGSGGLILGYKSLVAQATSGIHRADLLPGAERQHVTINGPKNILLVGTDARPGQNPNELVRADSIIILHVPSAHDRGYLVSIPRDSYVEIPQFDNGKMKNPRHFDKINAAFAFGGQGLTGEASRDKAFQLLTMTITNLTGITFDAGAIVDFAGFDQVMNVLGGVNMCIDEDTTSIFDGYDKNGKIVSPAYNISDDGVVGSVRKGITPVVYKKGCRHLESWEALDYVRQRDILANNDGDYGRQRHQQQFLKAVFKEVASAGVLTDIPKLNKVLKAIGGAMTLDDGNIPVEDWVYAMRGMAAGNLVTIRTNGGQFSTQIINGTSYQTLTPDSMTLLHAVKDDDVDTFIAGHQNWVSADS